MGSADAIVLAFNPFFFILLSKRSFKVSLMIVSKVLLSVASIMQALSCCASIGSKYGMPIYDIS